MKKYTYDELISLGYKIENAKITSVNLSMEDHGCLTFNMGLDGKGWGCIYGGYCIGKGYLGADEFSSYPHTAEYIMMIMNTVGTSKFNNMVGKYVRVATKGWGDTVKIIGNVIDDVWFDTKSFFEDYNE